MSKKKPTNTNTVKSDFAFDFGVANSFDLDFDANNDISELYKKPLTKSNKFNK